ncbi:class I SAM-dependent methyltransferase [Mobilitalea sibirica]|uniref:Class I SAM-dependent methyltransferase n=1 Tax=Mobilitalea sibirica TaxID=1462919 RepID=A0A8J7H2D7_9FIRM|nr:class I SAM-dependent methyltransferase [Mobilitalea sibirica]MBH1940907.1 class I SAM-dependent methyltransferase [Mobilitalea sibirica]
MGNHQTESFYERIADKYHWFFSSWDNAMKRQMQELIPLLHINKVRTVLDCSCGTGLQAIGLAKEGFHVTGSDISNKMLEIARKNAEKDGIKDIHFIQADFRDIQSKMNGSFDAVISFGNSIPHLHRNCDILDAFTNIYNCLNNGGLAVFDIRNYDDMLINKPKFLPMRIHDEKDEKIVSILYVFDYLDDIIRFNVVYLVEDKTSGEKSMEVEVSDYYPIKSAVFVDLLKEAGFINIEIIEKGSNIHFIGYKL